MEKIPTFAIITLVFAHLVGWTVRVVVEENLQLVRAPGVVQ